MITGRQIRDARMLLGWSDKEFCHRADVEEDVLMRAEAAISTPSITLYQAARIQQAFEQAGIRFGWNGAVMRVSVGTKR